MKIRKFSDNNEYRCILYTQIKPRNRHKYDSSHEKAERDRVIQKSNYFFSYSIIGFTYFRDCISVYLTMSLSESVSRSDERSEWRQINSENEPSR